MADTPTQGERAACTWRIERPTKAERIARLFRDDGGVFHRGGFHISDVCKRFACKQSSDDHAIKYGFDDGSAIVIAEGGWDLALLPDAADCFCWAGIGNHVDECQLQHGTGGLTDAPNHVRL